MDFTLSPQTEDIRKRIRAFVEDHLLALEADPGSFDEHENINLELLGKMREKAKSDGLWALAMPTERGGRGLDTVSMAVCYEEMNRSIFGPVVFNAAAPDDGNMIVLNKVGTEAQKDKWLQPIIDGTVRSSIVITEPPPGAGSDPAGMMKTTATKKDGGWLLEGPQWFITGPGPAQHVPLVARASDAPGNGLPALTGARAVGEF